MAEAIRVLLADDHPVVRSGIRAALELDGDIQVVGEAVDGAETQQLCGQLRPDILLLDINMPGPKVTDTIETVRTTCPETRIVMLTAHDDDTYIRAVMRAGVAGYLLKDEAVDTVVKAVKAVRLGAAWFSEAIAQKFIQWQVGHGPEIDDAQLTNRERELLGLIGRGWDNARIAADLGLAEQTVRNYTSILYDKIKVHSRAEAVVWAREHGFSD